MKKRARKVRVLLFCVRYYFSISFLFFLPFSVVLRFIFRFFVCFRALFAEGIAILHRSRTRFALVSADYVAVAYMESGGFIFEIVCTECGTTYPKQYGIDLKLQEDLSITIVGEDKREEAINDWNNRVSSY